MDKLILTIIFTGVLLGEVMADQVFIQRYEQELKLLDNNRNRDLEQKLRDEYSSLNDIIGASEEAFDQFIEPLKGGALYNGALFTDELASMLKVQIDGRYAQRNLTDVVCRHNKCFVWSVDNSTSVQVESSGSDIFLFSKEFQYILVLGV